MDHTARFKAMKLHQRPHREDFATFPFQETARIQREKEIPKEKKKTSPLETPPKNNPNKAQVPPKDNFYGCAFNPYAAPEEQQLVAICGADGLHVYLIPEDINRIKHVWGCTFDVCVNGKAAGLKSESLYTVTWAYDTYDAGKGRNPYKLVTGGTVGHIYVVDFATKNIDNKLRGFGSEINEIRVSPANSNLVATASADESVRIHHIRNQAPLITIGGHRTFMGPVLSVDWHSNGNYIVTSGFDHQIMKWDLSVDPAKSWLEETCKKLEDGNKNVFYQDMHEENDKTVFNPPVGTKRLGVDSATEVVKEVIANHHKPFDHFLELFTPAAICSDLHGDYVDCIRMLPGSDLFASKASGNDPHINISRFGVPKGIPEFKDRAPVLEPEMGQTTYQWFRNPSGETWFTKFVIDPHRRWLVCSGSGGEVFFFDLKEDENIKKNQASNKVVVTKFHAVRHLDFSPCGRFLIACTDDGIISRMDRLSSDIDPSKVIQFRNHWTAPHNCSYTIHVLLIIYIIRTWPQNHRLQLYSRSRQPPSKRRKEDVSQCRIRVFRCHSSRSNPNAQGRVRRDS